MVRYVRKGNLVVHERAEFLQLTWSPFGSFKATTSCGKVFRGQRHVFHIGSSSDDEFLTCKNCIDIVKRRREKEEAGE